MTSLKTYMDDGAHPSAQAVLCLLKHFEIESSWNSELRRYEANIKVARWENCREQGYVLMLKSNDYTKLRQLNIAFFEHRNSDDICAVKWEQVTLNTPTIETAKFGDVYKDKYDVSHSVNYKGHYEMMEWIRQQFEEFWEDVTTVTES